MTRSLGFYVIVTLISYYLYLGYYGISHNGMMESYSIYGALPLFFLILIIDLAINKYKSNTKPKIKTKPQPNAVAYLIFYILIFLFIFGIIYSLLSDVRDYFPPLFNQLGAMSGEYHDVDTIWGFDILNFLLSFSVAFAVIGLIWYSYEMSQKPNIPW